MITKLTPQQEDLIPVYRDKWLKNGLRTDQLDHAKSIESVHWVYKEILGKSRPSVIFVQSPVQATLTAALLKEICKDGQNLRQNLEQNLGQNLEQNLGQNLGQNLWQNLGQNLWQNLEPQAEPRAEPLAEPRTEPLAEPRAEPQAEPRTEPLAEPKQMDPVTLE